MARRNRETPWAAVVIPVVTALLVVIVASACAPDTRTGQSLVRVPQDAPSISRALELVAQHGLVLVDPGIYPEAVTVTVPDVTIRGTDRNGVVIDGEGLRQSGIVVTAPGVTVENLTVRNHNFYGVLVTGMPGGGGGHDVPYSKPAPDMPLLQRFRVDHVTAINNGLYGIYSFHAQHGVIEDSYASGSADSGIYVGQCRDCDIVVRGNLAERNAVGFENANASDSVYVVGNRWSGNRVGMTLISSYQEDLRPQRANLVVGNLITDNTSAESPVQADGGFGIGIGISGGQDNQVERNRITGNRLVGILLNNAEDLPATGNSLLGNSFDGNGVDVADTSQARAAGSRNCVDPAAGLDVRPAGMAARACPTSASPAAGIDRADLPALPVPPGVDFLQVPEPPTQPDSTNARSTEPTGVLPATVGSPDVAAIPVPSKDLLAQWAGVR